MHHSRGTAAALAAIALAGTAAGCSGGGSHAGSISSVKAPGRIMAYADSASQLVTETATAAQRTVLHGTVASQPDLSADSAYLVSSEGDTLLRVTATGVKRMRSPVVSTSTQDFEPAQPFLDHNRYILAATDGSKHATIKAVPLAGGKAKLLGHGYDVSGDPRSLAAYVSIASGPQVSDLVAGALVQPVGRIVRMAAGQAPHTLITTKQIDRLSGQSARTHWLMSATPNPDGSDVLVTALTLDAPSPRSLLAVLNPSGQVIASATGSQLGGGYWSPDGSHAAYLDLSKDQLVVWQPATGTKTSIPVPAEESGWYDCIWSPDGSWLVCAGGHAIVRGDPTTRLLVDLTDRKTATMKTSDIPVTWLAGS